MKKSNFNAIGREWKLCARPKKNKSKVIIGYDYFAEHVTTRKRVSISKLARRRLRTSQNFLEVVDYYKNGTPKYQKLPPQEEHIKEEIIKAFTKHDLKETIGEEEVDFIEFFKKITRKKDHSTYRASLKRLVEFIKKEKKYNGKLPFNEVTQEFIESWYNYLYSKVSSNTASQYFRRASIVWNEAKHLGLVDSEPFKKFGRRNRKKLKIQKTETNYLTPKQIEQLATCKSSIDSVIRAAFLFSCYTGLRYSDVIRVKWSDIDLATRKLKFRQKKSSSEVVYLPLSSKAISFLKMMPAFKKGGGLVFKGLPSDSTYINYHLQKWADEARLDINFNLTYHRSRHSFGTNYYRVCGDIYKVKRAMGHSSIEQTMRYAKVNVQDMAEELERM